MMDRNNSIDVSNLCSRKLLDILKNREWNTSSDRLAIKRELLNRRHYLNEVAEIEPVRPTRH